MSKSHTVLVTGGAGYIGGIAVEALLKEGFNVIVIDNFSTGHEHLLPKEITFYKSDIGDKNTLENIFSNHKIDVVLHFAGAALVEESTKNPEKYYDINFLQPLTLLNAMEKFNVKNIIFSSTCAVYGIPEDTPIKESTITKPINPYGKSKLLFEEALKENKKKNKLNFIALRYFNVAGASETRGELHEPETHLIPLVIRKIKNKEYKLKIFGNDYNTKDGTTIRDYVHVLDLVDAHVKALKILLSNDEHEDVYNIGYGKGFSILEIIKTCEKVFQTKIEFEFEDKRPGDPPILVSDPKNFINDFNWNPKYNDIEKIINSSSKFCP